MVDQAGQPLDMDNSRTSIQGAGWNCTGKDLNALLPPPLQNKPAFSWLRPKTLLGSRNDTLSRLFGDPSHEQRELWLEDLYPNVPRRLDIDHSELAEPSFIVMGDPGEGDTSQYAPLAVLDEVGADTDFMVICSDVIYPAGGVLEYAYKFCWPYRNYPAPIYALPGNHDWYDDLRGFMAYFCAITTEPQRPKHRLLSRARLRDRLWLRAVEEPDLDKTEKIATLRQSARQKIRQPGPYCRIQTGPVDLITIDTGIDGTIDARQGAWLREVSTGPKPKILLTGKPLVVDGKLKPCAIRDDSGDTVHAIVSAPESHYIAAIGGDIHNYQRYPITSGGRTIQYIVSGGGGAFMHPTHNIPDIDTSGLSGVTESEFRCYPLRGDSLSFYSQLYDKKFPGTWSLSPKEAALYMSNRLGIPPTKSDVQPGTLTPEIKRRGDKVFPRPGKMQGPLHLVFSEFFDWNNPPLFKNFLRIDASPTTLTIRCYTATGCDDELPPKVEDLVTCDLPDGATWS